jgi:thiamine pyrophosphate-dependent acetolactate synthase large subunit-like protein
MADAYSHVSGRLGVASVTHGPGLTNTITALVGAVRKRSQVLLITGETPSRRDHLQSIDVRTVASLSGAGYERVYNAEDVVVATDRAFRRVMMEHLPVVLDVPADLLISEIGDELALSTLPDMGAVACDPRALDNALGLIASANRPVILAGRGAVEANARAALIELADIVGATLATTLLAKDYFRGHPFNLGICGTLSSAVGSTAISAADCVIAFGASLNQHTAGFTLAGSSGSLLARKRIVQCEIDPARIGVVTPIAEPVVGDARTIALAMIEELRAAGVSSTGARDSQLECELSAASSFDDFTDCSSAETVDPRTAMARIDEILPTERVVVTDGGRFVRAAWRFLHVTDPSCFVTTIHFGSIGLGLSAAIGAAAARPEVPTIAVLGDGGFMMNMAEFATAVSNHMRLVVVIVNDGAYGQEYRKLLDYGIDPTYSLNNWPEFAVVAEAMGGRGLTVRSLEQLDVLAELLPELEGPLLVDLKVDPALDTRM